MKVAIAGGSGFVGKALAKLFIEKGYEVIILTRNTHPEPAAKKLQYVSWLSTDAIPEKDLEGIDAFVNLSGESLNSGRWTKTRKKEIIESRISTTKEVKRILTALEKKPSIVVQASAIGIYGTSLEQTFTENTINYGHDFLAETVKAWENEAQSIADLGIRTCFARFGVILGRSGGALPLIALPYKLFAGGTVGSGQQWVSWVHLEDVARAILFMINQPDLSGPINVTAPAPIQMKEFGKTLAEVLKRPHWMPTPDFALRTVLGEKSILVLEGQKVLPERLEKEGFTFQFPTLERALEQIFTK